MNKTDIDMIEFLLDQNEMFYEKGLINIDEYDEYNLVLIDKMEKILSKSSKLKLNSIVIDEFTLPKFKLSIETIKAVAN